jgi:hypothetical protein
MTTDPKTYTLLPNLHWSHTKNHKLVRAAFRRGLTGIKIIYQPNLFKRSGWYLESDQVPTLFCGFNAAEAEARINRIETVTI